MDDPRSERNALIRRFLNAAGWASASLAPLAGDASNRRYLRVVDTDRIAVLMDAPPDQGEDTQPFIAVTNWLRALDLSAPQILAADNNMGFLLLEDLGDALFARHLQQKPKDSVPLYGAAVDLLLRVSRARAPDWMADYDKSVLEREAALFCDWWLPLSAGQTIADDARADFLGLVNEVTGTVAETRQIAVLRDYHAENLLWLPDRSAHANVGLLDYQDALAGHPAYDLVSLLEDARRDTELDLQQAMLARYLMGRPYLDRDAFLAAYSTLGAQRNLKIIGIFARLAVRDGKPRYLGLIPRVWGHLQNDLKHPALASLARWLAQNTEPPTPAKLAALVAQSPR
ncbi:MAG: phosphotransferase [Pseudomonadota bacterium]